MGNELVKFDSIDRASEALKLIKKVHGEIPKLVVVVDLVQSIQI
jgi:hypothetical protein